MNRRKFMQKLGRGAMISMLALGSGYLLFREKPNVEDECRFDFLCANCKKVKTCGLPEAKDYKKQN